MLNKLQQQNVNIQILLIKCHKIKEKMLYDRQLNLVLEIKKQKNIHTIIHYVITKENFGINDFQYPLIGSFLINLSRQLVNIEDRLIKLIQTRNRLKKKRFIQIKQAIQKIFAIADKLEQSSSYKNVQTLTFLNIYFIFMNNTLTQFIFINIHVFKLILIKK
ncbi:unnamed protein product [Paramecium primaurelia]|uniref:Transmembrane protein n=1 Tax=Paramecium primaurelia TaxID=5886 RepID=A0A8S1N1Q9_PARPR|nr:unnamed protein product [Paramecium primaurelia]